jgi:hypothetical protein
MLYFPSNILYKIISNTVAAAPPCCYRSPEPFPGCVTAWRKRKGRVRTDTYDNRSICTEMNTSIYWTHMCFTYKGHVQFCWFLHVWWNFEIIVRISIEWDLMWIFNIFKSIYYTLYLTNLNTPLHDTETDTDFVYKFQPARKRVSAWYV